MEKSVSVGRYHLPSISKPPITAAIFTALLISGNNSGFMPLPADLDRFVAVINHIYISGSRSVGILNGQDLIAEDLNLISVQVTDIDVFADNAVNAVPFVG